MLITFAIDNYLSFKDKTSFCFEAASIKEHPDNTFTPAYFSNEYKLLKSIAIYGANSSGKSNLLKAFAFMQNFVLNSSKESQSFDTINVESFKLSEETENSPTTFEVTIIIGDSRYRYGFMADKRNIIQEWLFVIKKRSEEPIFIRAGQNFEISKSFKTGELKLKLDMITQITRINALFVSVLSQFNVELGKTICNWFNNALIVYDSSNDEIIEFTSNLLQDADFNKKINTIIDKSKLGFSSVSTVIREKAIKSKLSAQFIANNIYNEGAKSYNVYTRHRKFKGTKEVGIVEFDLIKNESLGTQKFFGLLGPIMYSLKHGGLLFVDELDSRLHTLLLDMIIKLFNSKGNNFNGAQLVFTSHNTNPLVKRLRRDQMFLVDKDIYGVSSISNLNKKFPKVRNDASFEKDYLAGKYQGIPGFDSELGGQLNLFDSEKK